jgi:hypothetical protein
VLEAAQDATSRVDVLRRSRQAILFSRLRTILPAACVAVAAALLFVAAPAWLQPAGLPDAGALTRRLPWGAGTPDPVEDDAPRVRPSDEAPAPVPVAPAEPARVRFVAYPWAEVRIDDGEPFLTPRAAPISLAPGSHVATFRHPRFGETRIDFDLEPGQERLIRHFYEQATRP